MSAKDIMTKEVITVPPDMNLEKLVEVLSLHRISGAPVVDEGGVLSGLVSLSDIAQTVSHSALPARWTSFSHDLWPPESFQDIERVDLQLLVSDIMNETTFEVSEETALREVADLLLNLRVHRVVVVDAQRRVKGVITTFDLVRHLRDILDRDAALSPG